MKFLYQCKKLNILNFYVIRIFLKYSMSNKYAKYGYISVTGNNVTPEQAAELIMMTHNPSIRDGPNVIFREKFKDIVPIENKELNDFIFDCFDAIGNLDLYYLCNNKIVAPFEGWCDWNGDIGCNLMLIDNWPTKEDIENEWKIIINNFPFLNLKCYVWLIDREDEEIFNISEIDPDFEFIINNNKVICNDYIDRTKKWNCSNIEDNQREYSKKICNLQTLRYAIDVCLKKINNPK